jgi:hypothetical protein
MEIDTRPITVSSTSSMTIHVSFNRAFTSPPQVLVSFGGVLAVGSVGNIGPEGFELTVKPSEGGGSGTFTYQAFGD